eukprot:273250_1
MNFLLQLCWSRHIHSRCNKHITNSIVINDLKSLFGKKAVTERENKSIIVDALNIYNQIHEKRNHSVIHVLVKLFLRFKQPHNIALIWNDIEQLNNTHNNETFMYPLLFKCCVESNEIVKAILILKWMNCV